MRWSRATAKEVCSSSRWGEQRHHREKFSKNNPQCSFRSCRYLLLLLSATTLLSKITHPTAKYSWKTSSDSSIASHTSLFTNRVEGQPRRRRHYCHARTHQISSSNLIRWKFEISGAGDPRKFSAILKSIFPNKSHPLSSCMRVLLPVSCNSQTRIHTSPRLVPVLVINASLRKAFRRRKGPWLRAMTVSSFKLRDAVLRSQRYVSRK